MLQTNNLPPSAAWIVRSIMILNNKRSEERGQGSQTRYNVHQAREEEVAFDLWQGFKSNVPYALQPKSPHFKSFIFSL
jgi:hypothetical protein